MRLLRAVVCLTFLVSCASGASTKRTMPPTPSSSTTTTSTSSTTTTSTSPSTSRPFTPIVPSTTVTASRAVPSTTTTAGATPASRACGARRPAPVHYDHVLWIWMENHQRSQVLGGSAAPYLTALARDCGGATDYRSVGAPSLPNYLGATAGTTSGVTDDASPGAHLLTNDNLFRQVRRADGSAITYAEAMPETCALQGSGRYAVKHNPATYYTGGDDREACGRDDRPVASASALLASLTHDPLPTFAFVVPDLCDDTHDCSVARGDQWLASWLPSFLASDSYTRGDTAIFVVWDEPTPMPFVAIAPTIPPGATMASPVDHYSLLRTSEELLGLDRYLGAAAGAPSMRAALGM